MFEVTIPFRISETELDARLAAGWFRSASSLFRAELLHLDDRLRPLSHIRHVLDGPIPSATLRRLLRRNRARFTVRIRPARVESSRRRLYRLTMPRFMGLVAEDLEPLVLGELPDVFDTREVCVYDGTRLVAASFFDLGHEALAGLLAIHDPAYARHSLGIYTMLEELEFGRSEGARYYYPGFVVPGMPAFDYKRRIGRLEYLGPAGWGPEEDVAGKLAEVARVEERIAAMEAALRACHCGYARRFYPGFWAGRALNAQSAAGPGRADGMIRFAGQGEHELVDSMVQFGPSLPTDEEFLLVEYVIEDDVFSLVRAVRDPVMSFVEDFHLQGDGGRRMETRTLARLATLLRDPSPERIARALRARS